jgi:retron-type reverse transcriptase
LTDYEKVCDFQNLYKAHISSRRGKRGKSEVISFELDLARNITTLHRELTDKTYRMSGYYHFTVSEPKTREIYAAYYPDRVVLHCVCDEVLTPLLQKRVIYDNAACQIGKGTHFAIDRLTKFLREHYSSHGAKGYVLKCDVAKYFASVNHAVLKAQMEKIVADRDIRDMLFRYIDSYETEGRPGVGVPLGNQTSQWFGVYYMDTVDRLIKEKLKIKHYIRYMDDLVLIHRDKAYLSDCLAQIRGQIEDKLKLELNGKTQIFPLRGGIEFLGWRFYLTETGKVVRKLKTQSKLRYKRRLKKLQSDYAAGVIGLEDVNASLASCDGHLMHGHTYKLKSKVMTDFVLICHRQLSANCPLDNRRGLCYNEIEKGRNL